MTDDAANRAAALDYLDEFGPVTFGPGCGPHDHPVGCQCPYPVSAAERDRLANLTSVAAPAVHLALSGTGGCNHADWREKPRCAEVADRLAAAPLPLEQARWAFLNPETGDWIEVRPGTVALAAREPTET